MKANDVVSLIRLIKKDGIGVWVDGGWGVDALLGKQTRPHLDLDIIVQKKEVDKLCKLLVTLGYKKKNEEGARAWNFVMVDDAGREVDIHVIKIDKKGNGIYGPKANGQMYPAESLKSTGTINGLRVKCLSADYQIVSHSGYELKEKDRADIAKLKERLGAVPSEKR